MSVSNRQIVASLVTVLVICFVAFRWNLGNREIETMSDLTVKLHSCSTPSVLCGVELQDQVEQSTDASSHIVRLNSLKAKFYRLVMPDYKRAAVCPQIQRFGRQGDGGYDICMTPAFRPQPGNCLVYSFGINREWSFDEAIANNSCEVHSFDPSMNMKDHIHSPRVYFHNIGLWGEDYVNQKNWTLQSLSTIRRGLGHDKRPIDILKVDVEIAEWPFLRDVTIRDPHQLSDVRQLLIELHASKYRPVFLTESDLAEIIHYLERLVSPSGAGFFVYRNRQFNNCCGRFTQMMPNGIAEKCCYEVFLLNSRYL